ncbi:uncharacterized protein P884DRAFT_290687, partial [Thermothelomyces heterothallicus CBS 202.75]|uniref:uncharacterized protein n=1 Tax=Thermothelomyces heterothallicus CBS 202.75 TaxID=1149848 RepID=UPI00374232E3
MQGDVTGGELARSIVAFAIPSVTCLISIICTWVFGERRSLPRPYPDWEILVATWPLFSAAGICLAVLTAQKRDVRYHLALKGVGFLSVDVRVVVVLGRAIFLSNQDVPLLRLLVYFILFGAIHLLLLGLGIWKLLDGGSEFIWAVPSTHHFAVFLFLVSLFIYRAYRWGRWGESYRCK